MCLAIPAQVTAIESDGRRATVVIAGIDRTVDLAMTPGVGVGDWVVTHSGFAVRAISAGEAAELQTLWSEIEGQTRA